MGKTNLGNGTKVLNGHYFKLAIRKMAIPLKTRINNIGLIRRKVLIRIEKPYFTTKWPSRP